MRRPDEVSGWEAGGTFSAVWRNGLVGCRIDFGVSPSRRKWWFRAHRLTWASLADSLTDTDFAERVDCEPNVKAVSDMVSKYA